MQNRAQSAMNLVDIMGDMMSIPDSFFTASTGTSMLDGIMEQVDVEEMAAVQTKEFLDQGMSYDQVAMACAEMKYDVAGIIASFEDEDMISEKKVFFKQLFTRFLDMPEYILKDYPRYDTEIHVELTHPEAQMPVYAHEGDAGADVSIVEDVVIQPGEILLLPVGFKMAIQPGWTISVRPRSGLSLKTTYRIANAPGTIDSNYLGEVAIVAENIGTEPVELKAKQRVAQFILERAYKAEYAKTDDVTKHTTENRANEKGEQGFGSTGN